MVNRKLQLIDEAESIIDAILESLGVRIEEHTLHARSKTDRGSYLSMNAISGRTKFQLGIEIRSRVTPQTALSICEQVRRRAEGSMPVIYAPVISPRVAEILRTEGVGYVDRWGNCWLRSRERHLLIERRGIRADQGSAVDRRRLFEPSADPFAPKSSRIVRLMLNDPMQAWQVRKLADHPDVAVSPGLVVKVKRALIEEGYAVEHERKLRLRDPAGLLNAWAEKYPEPVESIPMYVRGDLGASETAVRDWCRELGIRFAFAGFSAGWRLAPMVRYSVATIFLEDRGYEPSALELFAKKYGGRRVESGPTLILWRPYDPSVLAFGRESDDGEPITSPVQTYLDLKRAGGRGDEAAAEVYDRHLKHDFDATIAREKERRHALV